MSVSRLEPLIIGNIQTASDSWTVVQRWNALQPAIDSRRMQAASMSVDADVVARNKLVDELVLGETALSWAVLSKLQTMQNDQTGLFELIKAEIHKKDYLKTDLDNMKTHTDLATRISKALFSEDTAFDLAAFNKFQVVVASKTEPRQAPSDAPQPTPSLMSTSAPTAPPQEFEMSEGRGTRRTFEDDESAPSPKKTGDEITNSIGTLVAQGIIDSF
jgi:hypothetical protein